MVQNIIAGDILGEVTQSSRLVFSSHQTDSSTQHPLDFG
jgi:hypothetical protein